MCDTFEEARLGLRQRRHHVVARSDDNDNNNNNDKSGRRTKRENYFGGARQRSLAGSYQIRKITGLNRTPRPRPSRFFRRLTIQVSCPRRSDWILPKAVVGIRRTYRRDWCKAAIDKCSFAIPRQQTEGPYKLAMKTTTTDEHRGKTPQFL